MLKNAKMWMLLALLATGTALYAQAPAKYGHMNMGNLLESLPDAEKANESLKKYAEQLSVKDDSLVKAFQANYAALEKQVNDLAPVVLQQKQAELQKQQEFIQKFEEEAQNMVAKKREELLTPILAKIKDAIKAVAKENGYAMIFDVGSGVTLFVEESDDITPLVKKKLGL